MYLRSSNVNVGSRRASTNANEESLNSSYGSWSRSTASRCHSVSSALRPYTAAPSLANSEWRSREAHDRGGDPPAPRGGSPFSRGRRVGRAGGGVAKNETGPGEPAR